MLVFCCAATCVLLKDKTGYLISLIGILGSLLIVVTRHDVRDLRFLIYITFDIFPIALTL